jgi:hypothetical protein
MHDRSTAQGVSMGTAIHTRRRRGAQRRGGVAPKAGAEAHPEEPTRDGCSIGGSQVGLGPLGGSCPAPVPVLGDQLGEDAEGGGGRRMAAVEEEARTSMACCTSPFTPHSGEGEGAAALESGAEDAKFATGVTPTSRRCRMRRRRSSEYGAVSISGKSDHWRSG